MSTLTLGKLDGLLSLGKAISATDGTYLAIPGVVVNVVQTVKKDSFSASPAATTYSDITGLTASITPKSVNNKILVILDLYVGAQAYQVKGRLKRDGNPIFIGDAAGNRPRTTFVSISYTGNSNEYYHILKTGGSYLDSPSTTSSITYSVDIAAYSTYPVYVNRSYQWQNTTDYDAVPVSSLTLLEIAG